MSCVACYNDRMSDAEQFYVEAIKKRFVETIRGLDLPPDKLDKAKQHFMEALEASLRDGLATKITLQDLEKFIDRILNRQGTHFEDFNELYKNKAELERKLFGDYQ
jgi:hypothetical protein